MYGLKWPFLLRYGSHDTRRIIFRGLIVNENLGFGASQLGIRAKVNDYLGSSVGVELSISKLGIRISRA